MTKFAVIDTEGSGLFDFAKPADAPGQPRLASFAMLLLDEKLEVVEEVHYYVKPDGWKMEAGAIEVNGLTDQYLADNGVPVTTVLKIYTQAIEEGYAIAAFNAQHDCKTMRAELRLAGMPDLFLQTRNFCCMRKSQGIIPRPDGKKSWPKLEHARLHLGISNEGAHSAIGDARSALVVLRHLRDQGVDLTPEVHFAKESVARSPAVDPSTIRPVADAPISRPRSVKPAPSAVPLADQEIPQ